MALAKDDRSPAVKANMIIFLCLTWISFSLRAWVRLRILKAPGFDDLLTFISLLFFTVFGGWVLYAAHFGTGKHNDALTPEALRNALMGGWGCEIFYILCTAILKCAVGTFILRVATQKRHRWIVWGMIGMNIVFNIFYFFQSLFQCVPVSFYWNRFDPRFHGRCTNPKVSADATYAQSAISILTDWTYGILPIFIVWNLQMSKQKRFGVAVVLGLGAVASAATIVRVPYLVTLTNTSDFLFATVDVAIWSAVEPGIGITSVGLATLRPLFHSCLSRAGLSSRDYQRSTSHPNGRGGHMHRKRSPYGLGSASTDLSIEDRGFRKGNSRSKNFYEEESPHRDVERGMPLDDLSPKAAALMGSSPAGQSGSVTGKEILSTSHLTDMDPMTPKMSEGSFAVSRPPSQHANFSRPQSRPHTAGGSGDEGMSIPRPPSSPGREDEVINIQRTGGFSYV